MGVPTEPRAGADEAASCPVCGEPLPTRPERCFRCETPLVPWWQFETVLRQLVPLRVAPPGVTMPRRRRVVAVFAVAAGVLAGAAGLIVARSTGPPAASAGARSAPAKAPSAAGQAVVPAPPETAGAARPPLVRYRVQRGDSLWRIAAAFTGDGRRWRELWPQHAEGTGRIAAGAELEIDLRLLAHRAR